MPKKTTTAIVPTKNLQPPPKKTEIVEAMALIEYERQKEEYENQQKKSDQLKEKLDKRMNRSARVLAKEGEMNYHFQGSGNWRTLVIGFRIPESKVPKDILAMHEERMRICARHPDPINKIKQNIRAKMAGLPSATERIEAIAKDPKFRKEVMNFLHPEEKAVNE